MKSTWKKTIEVPGNWQNEELLLTLGLQGQGQEQCYQSPPVLEPGARGQKLSRDSLEVPREGKKSSPPLPLSYYLYPLEVSGQGSLGNVVCKHQPLRTQRRVSMDLGGQ